jgi:hypothetical protein
VQKLERQTEVQEELAAVAMRRCVCPVCRSRDVWKWGRPTFIDRLMLRFLNRSPLTCRRCGYKFHRKVIFGHAD